MMHRHIVVCLLPLLTIVSAGCGHDGGRKADIAPTPLPTVQVMTVMRGTLERRLPVTGTLQSLPGQEATLSPPVTGVLSGLFVRYGQSVSKGQMVAQLSTQPLVGQIQQAEATLGQNQVQVQQAEANALQQQAQTRTAIFQAEASVKNAQATLAGAEATLTGSEAALHNSEQSLERERTLFADGLVAQKDVEAAELAVRTAQAQVSAQQQTVAGQQQTVAGQRQALAAARAASLQDVVKRKDVEIARQQVRNALGALNTARSQLALYTLRAPLSGQVTSVGVTVGETVDTAAKVAVIANLSALQLKINLPSDSLSQIHRGLPLTFTVNSLKGHTFSAVIETIAPTTDAATGTVPALALVSNPNHALKDDTVARVQILVERRSAILIVPQAAVLTDPDTGKASIVTVGSDGTAHVVSVQPGLSAGGRVAIKSGLADGQQVAVSGQYGLPDGAKVQVQRVP